MRMPALRRRRAAGRPGLAGPARLDRRTNRLARRLRPGDVAIIDHVDLDRSSALALVRAGAAAVINVAPCTSGRYPNLGPQVLVDAGVLLVEVDGADLFTRVSEGSAVRIDDGVIYSRDTALATGRVLDLDAVAANRDAARAGMASQLEAFSANTVEFIRRERDLLLDGLGVPATASVIEGRHVVIVSRDYDYRADLAGLRSYLRERRPILIGVDAGADVLVETGHPLDLVVGDVRTISDAALRGAKEVVVHAPRDGRAVGLDRLERLGVDGTIFETSGTSEDAAVLLADTHGAELIVAVGSHATLVEFLDKGRSGMASTYLTRLRVGPTLVDAKVVAALYRSPVRTWQILLLVLAALLAVGFAIAATPVGGQWVDDLRAVVADLWQRLLDQVT
ncbi:MAG: putative cytokinetic ring protein SteA [Actinomycetota bacterium]|nr:putative cytokinetic ring protein SteA [Actinomycetota bacterium]